MRDTDRIRRLEMAVAALAEILQDTNPHIEVQLIEMAEILGGEPEITDQQRRH